MVSREYQLPAGEESRANPNFTLPGDYPTDAIIISDDEDEYEDQGTSASPIDLDMLDEDPVHSDWDRSSPTTGTVSSNPSAAKRIRLIPHKPCTISAKVSGNGDILDILKITRFELDAIGDLLNQLFLENDLLRGFWQRGPNKNPETRETFCRVVSSYLNDYLDDEVVDKLADIDQDEVGYVLWIYACKRKHLVRFRLGEKSPRTPTRRAYSRSERCPKIKSRTDEGFSIIESRAPRSSIGGLHSTSPSFSSERRGEEARIRHGNISMGPLIERRVYNSAFIRSQTRHPYIEPQNTSKNVISLRSQKSGTGQSPCECQKSRDPQIEEGLYWWMLEMLKLMWYLIIRILRILVSLH
ncbi:hypothetical protein ABW19_dt0200139 [Dactylella cylindrospora]|nr:hypothetical protein ABW19_dt0200139 [Dactylella cylindrospora]